MTEPPLDPESRITPDNSLATATPLLFAHLLSWWGGVSAPALPRVAAPPPRLAAQTHASALAAPPLFRLALALQNETMNGLEKWGPRRGVVTPRHVWQEQRGRDAGSGPDCCRIKIPIDPKPSCSFLMTEPKPQLTCDTQQQLYTSAGIKPVGGGA